MFFRAFLEHSYEFKGQILFINICLSEYMGVEKRKETKEFMSRKGKISFPHDTQYKEM